MVKVKLLVDEQLKETAIHGRDDFPIEYYVDDLEKNDFIPLHWHQEFEFYYVAEGRVEVQIESNTILLNSGEGIFINSNMLHSFRPYQNSCHCLCPNVVFSPALLFSSGSLFSKKYCQEFLLSSEFSHLVLSESENWQYEILHKMKLIFSLLQERKHNTVYGPNTYIDYQNTIEDNPCSELILLSEFLNIWKLLYIHQDSFSHFIGNHSKQSSHLRLQQMIRFIQTNYQDSITLHDIAASANISRSEASRCFRRYASCSPVEYLIRHRINCAKQMLTESSDSITDIAEKCGFSTVGYFGKIFKKATGHTPAAFRNYMNI